MKLKHANFNDEIVLASNLNLVDHMVLENYKNGLK